MLNRTVVMGRLTADPELKYTQSGVSVTSFTLAVDRNYSQNGERLTDFFKCVAWRNSAEFISKYFQKGKLMVAEGEMQSRSWENSEGKKVTVWELIVSNAYFGGDKSESSYETVKTESSEEFTEVGNAEDDDLPF